MKVAIAAFWAVLFLAFNNDVADATEAANKDALHSRSKRAIMGDFDEHVRQWLEDEAKQVNRKISWYDSYGKHPHLKENPQYKRFQVSARSAPMNYNLTMVLESDKPQQVYTKWFCNHQANQPIKATISRELQRKAVFTWKQETGLKIGVEIKMEAKIPEVMDIGAKFNTELDFKTSKTQTKEETETFKILYNLNIDPQTAVRATWLITEKEVDIPYNVDVFVDGYTAVWYDEKYEDHWLWFIPTKAMAGGDFHPNGEDGLTFKASGHFNGVRGVDSVIEATEYALTDDMAGHCGGSGGPTFDLDATPIKVTRIHMPLPDSRKHGE